MKRALVTVGVLVAVQLALIGGWWLVERRRDSPGERPALAPRLATVTTTTERSLDQPAPPLPLRDLDGRPHRLDALRGPALVHVWATWCPPCRAELPGLIRFAAESAQPLWLISVDPDPDAVRRFFAGARLGSAGDAMLMLADAIAVERDLGVHALPVTFTLDATGNLRHRIDGARDWMASAREAPR